MRLLRRIPNGIGISTRFFCLNVRFPTFEFWRRGYADCIYSKCGRRYKQKTPLDLFCSPACDEAWGDE
jgi:hypothetical protein